MPINSRLSFGIAAYAPYGLHLQWDTDYTRNPGALYAWESKFVRQVLTPAFGYKVSDKLCHRVWCEPRAIHLRCRQDHSFRSRYRYLDET